jgi:hypothetical protein
MSKVTDHKATWLKVQSPDRREGEPPGKGLVGQVKSEYYPRYVRGFLRAYNGALFVV